MGKAQWPGICPQWDCDKTIDAGKGKNQSQDYNQPHIHTNNNRTNYLYPTLLIFICLFFKAVGNRRTFTVLVLVTHSIILAVKSSLWTSSFFWLRLWANSNPECRYLIYSQWSKWRLWNVQKYIEIHYPFNEECFLLCQLSQEYGNTKDSGVATLAVTHRIV